MGEIFTLVFYQPLFNALVLFYWMVGKTPVGYDMGIAVILLTILIRVLLLPLTIAGSRSEKERHAIQEKIREIREMHYADPVRAKRESKEVLRGQPRIIISEAVMFFVQLLISLVLWRIFATGLEGADIHLLYSWMPKVPEPYDLMFLGEYDLGHPHLILNVVQTILLFAMESLAVLSSPLPISKQEAFRLQIALPFVSFIIFAFLPAGKKLFVITTLSFSLIVIIVRMLVHAYAQMQERWSKAVAPTPHLEPDIPPYDI